MILSIKRTRRIINNIINTKNRKVENTVKKIIHDDVVHVDSGDIANMFNDYFVGVGKNIAESIGGNNANHLDYMTHINQPNSFFFKSIHCHSTEKLICSLKNKSSNLNTIPVKILKPICDIISPCLTNIIKSPSQRVYFLIASKKLVWRRYRKRVIYVT